MKMGACGLPRQRPRHVVELDAFSEQDAEDAESDQRGLSAEWLARPLVGCSIPLPCVTSPANSGVFARAWTGLILRVLRVLRGSTLIDLPPVRISWFLLTLAGAGYTGQPPALDELVHRPIPLRTGIGSAHDAVTSSSADAQR